MFRLPSGVVISYLIDDLRTFSWEASEILLYYAKILKDSNFKSNILKNDDYNNPVTVADLKVNDLIIKRINKKYENIDWEILSEENVKIEKNYLKNNSDWIWVLDPLDGTKDFIQGTGDYAMHLALNYKKKPLIGIVLIPDKDELWIADGEKVWCENRKGLMRKTNLSPKKNLQDMVLVTSKNHNNLILKNLIEKIKCNQVITMGSIGCKIASILRGESDIYICLSLPGKSSPKDWDFAAPQSILKAAGGSITNLDNEELSYGMLNYEQQGIIVASSDLVSHESLCLQIKEIIVKNKILPV